MDILQQVPTPNVNYPTVPPRPERYVGQYAIVVRGLSDGDGATWTMIEGHTPEEIVGTLQRIGSAIPGTLTIFRIPPAEKLP